MNFIEKMTSELGWVGVTPLVLWSLGKPNSAMLTQVIVQVIKGGSWITVLQ